MLLQEHRREVSTLILISLSLALYNIAQTTGPGGASEQQRRNQCQRSPPLVSFKGPADTAVPLCLSVVTLTPK